MVKQAYYVQQAYETVVKVAVWRSWRLRAALATTVVAAGNN